MTDTHRSLTLPEAVQLGQSYLQAGRLADAEAMFRRILAVEPNNLSLLETLGRITHQVGKPEQALEFFNRAVQLYPREASTHFNRGIVLEAQERLEEAEASYRAAVKCDPRFTSGHGNLGVVLHKLGKWQEAAESLQRSLAINPNDAKTHKNLGLTQHMLGDLEAAAASQRRALELMPTYAEAHNNLGAVLQDMGRIDEAESCYRKALELKPDLLRAQWNLSLILLLRGDMAAGLSLFEQRFEGGSEIEFARPRQILAALADKPRWLGEALNGRRLLVWAEQGVGDGIMMARFLPLLKDKGAGEIIVSCRAGLPRLIATLPELSRVIEDGAALARDAFDCHCPLMSLPYLFGTRLDTIPKNVPYFKIPSALQEKWVERLAALPGMKVGLVWAGSQSLRNDARRSIDFDRLAALLEIPGVQFISLQKEETTHHPALKEWMAECNDFLDTAALVQQLDLVISVDTAVAHLAGALAKPVWLLNRYESEWRWLLDREDSPWYPTMRIFRQPALNDWDSVIARVVAALREQV